jgi:hypothetical protein
VGYIPGVQTDRSPLQQARLALSVGIMIGVLGGTVAVVFGTGPTSRRTVAWLVFTLTYAVLAAFLRRAPRAVAVCSLLLDAPVFFPLRASALPIALFTLSVVETICAVTALVLLRTRRDWPLLHRPPPAACRGRSHAGLSGILIGDAALTRRSPRVVDEVELPGDP